MVHKEVERCLEDCPNPQHPRDTERERMDKRGQAIENAKRSDPVQNGNAEPDEDVVVK